MMNKFNKSLAIGKAIENYVASYLTGKGHLVDNKSDDAAYQSKDIDFILYKNGNTTTLEVKADSRLHDTHNFFFEVGFNRDTGYYDGWFRKCAAAYICFVDYICGKAYIIDFNKDIIAANATSKRWVNYYDECIGDALLLNIDKARELNLISYEWTFKEELL